MFSKLKIDGFVLALVITAILAYSFPFFSNILPLDSMTQIGVSLIFFFYGLKLSPTKIKSGLSNWKLHVLIQLCTFILFPAIISCFYPLFKNQENEILWFSFLFLASLPSTVSSSVVMVSIAKGNIPAAIFNASISGLIGIVVTPLWIQLFATQLNSNYELTGVYSKLLIEILLPICIGLILQKYWGKYTQTYRTAFTNFDRTVILLIVFDCLSTSFQNNLFASIRLFEIVSVFIGCVLLFMIVYSLIGFISKSLKFNHEDCITAQFCSSKKSLVHGTVFAGVLFPQTAMVGVILIPIIIYHSTQLLIVSYLASKKSKEFMS